MDEVDTTTNKLINNSVAVLDKTEAEFIKFWKTLFHDALLRLQHKLSTTEKKYQICG
jgi:hypothetical protein